MRYIALFITALMIGSAVSAPLAEVSDAHILFICLNTFSFFYSTNTCAKMLSTYLFKSKMDWAQLKIIFLYIETK